MAKFISLLFSFMSVCVLNGQTLDWAYRNGSSCSSNGNSITVDHAGHIITGGNFCGNTDFEPGSGSTYLNDAGGDDIFIQKVDDQSNLIWAKRIGADGVDRLNKIATDDQGNVFCIGTISSNYTVDFDPGPGIHNVTPGNGWKTAFVLKLDINGDFVWVKSFSANGSTDRFFMTDVETDNSGNVYVTGGFEGTADFDPGAGTFNLSSIGNFDVFTLKLDANGNFILASRIGDTDYDIARSISLDNSNNIHIVGNFSGTVDFDPGAGIDNHTSMGDEDCFVTKYDALGNLVWAKTFGSTQEDRANSLVVDDLGNVYSAGYYSGTTDFDPGTGTASQSNNGFKDMFIQKLNSNGDFVWIRTTGSYGDDAIEEITIDQSGNLYSTGEFFATVDFDSDGTGLDLTAYGSLDIFVQKHLPNGNFSWADHFGGNNNDIGKSIATDAYDNVYTVGDFRLTSNFAPSSSSSYNIVAIGNPNAFVQKLQQCSSNGSTQIVSACESYTWIDGNTYTSSINGPTHTLTNSSGCDSIVTLNLTINNSTSSTDVITSCDSYTWIDGNTYTSSISGPTHTIPNASGCDSLITLDLTINNSTTGTDIISACDEYTWIDGNTYTSSNSTTTHVLTTSEGCDSIVHLNLTINTVSATITETNNTLTATTAGADYQWLDCNTNLSEIVGEIGQSYAPQANGNYAVEVTQNGCVDTSNCLSISTIGMEEQFLSEIELYPNPNTGQFTLTFKNVIPKHIAIYDSRGVEVFKLNQVNKTNLIALQIANGLYLVEMDYRSTKVIKKLTVNN